MAVCPRCGTFVQEGVRFCPICGSPVQGSAPYGTATSGPMMGAPMGYPMAPAPYPMMMAPPQKVHPPKWGYAVTSGVLTTIAVCFLFISGLILLVWSWPHYVEGDYYWDDGYYTDWDAVGLFISIMSFFAFGLGIASAVAAFKMKWRVIAVLGPCFNIAAGAIGFETIVGLIALILSILAIIFVVLAIPHFHRPQEAPVPIAVIPPPPY